MSEAGMEWSYSGVPIITPSAAFIFSAISITIVGSFLSAGLLNRGISLISTNSIAALSAKCFCIYCSSWRLVERFELVPTKPMSFNIIISFPTLKEKLWLQTRSVK